LNVQINPTLLCREFAGCVVAPRAVRLARGAGAYALTLRGIGPTGGES
jgi:hypothetical protein